MRKYKVEVSQVVTRVYEINVPDDMLEGEIEDYANCYPEEVFEVGRYDWIVPVEVDTDDGKFKINIMYLREDEEEYECCGVYQVG